MSADHWPAVIGFIVAARARAINHFPLTKKRNISIQWTIDQHEVTGHWCIKWNEMVNPFSVDQINISIGSIGSIIQLFLLCSALNFKRWIIIIAELKTSSLSVCELTNNNDCSWQTEKLVKSTLSTQPYYYYCYY